MKLVDDVAGVVAQRHSGGPAVTASMDEMDFLAPVRVGDLVLASGQVNWAGRTSMEVGVRVLAEPWNKAGVEPIRVATAYLVFVAVDEDGRPREVPASPAGDSGGPSAPGRGRDPAYAPAGPARSDPALARSRAASGSTDRPTDSCGLLHTRHAAQAVCRSPKDEGIGLVPQEQGLAPAVRGASTAEVVPRVPATCTARAPSYDVPTTTCKVRPRPGTSTSFAPGSAAERVLMLSV